jgi:hypothetical protein
MPKMNKKLWLVGRKLLYSDRRIQIEFKNILKGIIFGLTREELGERKKIT